MSEYTKKIEDVFRLKDSTDIKELEIIICFAKIFKCKQFLEIGTYTGSFSISMTKVFGNEINIDTVDIPPNKYTPKILPEERAKAIPNIKFHRCGSDEFFRINEKKYDFVFIDGNHTNKQSAKDIQNAIECLSPNGIMFIHDVRKTKQRHKDVMRSFRNFNNENYIKFIIKTSRGLGVILPLKKL